MDRPLHLYRGETLALVVKAIGEVARAYPAAVSEKAAA
jgi:hypothetical protein